jgi:hypothetical protein
MKKAIGTVLILLVAAFVFAASGQEGKGNKKGKNEANTFGEKITKQGAVATTEVANLIGDKEKVEVKITGKINEVCKIKGCWMTADLGNGKSMRVTFKDYGFFVPKDAGGKTFWAEGEAKTKTTSIEMLKHYAEDAGKSKEEIEAIKEPKKELVFVAKGVIVE